ncbi:MAG: maleylpyruvate isomerase family mycothiol-dependent enzyme [Mobilicoccus sp.]|nr:maleylpyruvate isomerase family mycothiol-dependent enzyme [Mobilicoccus sp.]
MPMHPAAPVDLTGLIDAYAQTAQAIVDLVYPLSDKDFELETDCPGWTVKDNISHVVALEAFMTGRPDPEVEVPDYDHVHHDFARYIEQGVELRRERSGEEVVQELQQVVARRLGQLADLRDHEPEHPEQEMVATPRGEVSLLEALTLRVIDLWVHEQDIRGALGRPGNLDAPAAAVFSQTVLDALPIIVVKRAGVEPGKVVMIELTGPVVARAGVRVEKNEDGKPHGHLMFTGGTDETGPIPVIGKTTSIQLSTEAFTRRAAGRRATEDLHYSVHGDEQVARKVLDGLVITP